MHGEIGARDQRIARAAQGDRVGDEAADEGPGRGGVEAEVEDHPAGPVVALLRRLARVGVVRPQPPGVPAELVDALRGPDRRVVGRQGLLARADPVGRHVAQAVRVREVGDGVELGPFGLGGGRLRLLPAIVGEQDRLVQRVPADLLEVLRPEVVVELVPGPDVLALERPGHRGPDVQRERGDAEADQQVRRLDVHAARSPLPQLGHRPHEQRDHRDNDRGRAARSPGQARPQDQGGGGMQERDFPRRPARIRHEAGRSSRGSGSHRVSVSCSVRSRTGLAR